MRHLSPCSLTARSDEFRLFQNFVYFYPEVFIDMVPGSVAKRSYHTRMFVFVSVSDKETVIILDISPHDNFTTYHKVDAVVFERNHRHFRTPFRLCKSFLFGTWTIPFTLVFFLVPVFRID